MLASPDSSSARATGSRTLRCGAAAAIAALVGTVAMPRAAAAETIFPDVPVWTSPVEDTRGIALGDVDGDGDLDLVRACFNLPTTLTLNVGGVFAGAPAWSGPIEATRCVALGDVDGDGDLDLVRAHDTGRATLYLNTGGVFESAPVWYGQPEQSRAIALADVDGDGDLDLILANLNPGSTVYRNVNGRFEATPAWTGPVAESNGLAVGDVDGDGRLDLVLGNFNQPSMLFLNSASGFPAVPSWTGPVERTRAVALGDVDGDGDLDLVRGNLGAGSTLTLNVGGTFEAAPVWTGPVEQTYAIALGDVDDDGRLDLLRGNDGAATLTLNPGGRFGPAPSWIGPIEDSRSVALADVDGDGDLDLVRGNLLQASTLYLDVAGPLAPSPSWTGAPENTRAVAVGDVDGDGDLDLVRAGLGTPATLYRGTAGVLDTIPSWTGPAENTRAVALGDVDGDGDLDLVRGNLAQGSTLYLDTDGVFAGAPAWTGPVGDATAVALGDIDGDGDLDLVCGNFAQGATLFRNTGGTFEATPAWTGPVENTRAIALVDVDGDRDLDLVRGNEGQGATLYLNIGGVFAASPAWTGPVESTRGIAVGDVDGDGDPDLVRGNNQGSTLYLNTGGTFAAAPAWVGPTEPTVSVALGDLDGDGDLDLVRGNLDAAATVTLNHGGGLDPLPASTVPVDSSWSAVLADLDRDGDLDAVLGNSAWFANRSPWIAREGGATRWLPNNPAHLRRVHATRAAANHVTLAFDAVDVESDPLTIVGEYQFRGASPWQPLALGAGGAHAGPFATAPGGLAHTVDWDVTRVPFDRRDVVVRLRAVSGASRVGLIGFVPAYLENVGRVIPVRPSIAATPPALAFATVTLGDTVEVPLTIANTGNQALVIPSITTPSPAITVLSVIPLTVPPDSSRLLTVRLAPRAPLVAPGPIVIASNDPARPTLDVAVGVDVRDLVFQTQLLAVAPQLPLGQAATVVVTPAPGVRIESGWVLHRPSGAIAFADSSPLVRQGSNFIALIPSQSVTEAGLEYYVRVENSDVTRTDPPGAPATVHFYPVAAPTAVTSASAVPDERGVFPAGRATPIVVTLPAGAEFVEGAIHYRAGGAAVEDSAALEVRESSPGFVAPVAAIPAEAVGARGLEFWVRVRTRTTTLIEPPGADAGARKTVRVTVDRVAEPASHAASRYRLVSVPLELDQPVGTSLEALLSDQPEFGPPDPTRWRSYRFDPASNRYLEVGPASADLALHPEPGRSFWLIAAQPNALDTAPVPGRSTSTAAAFRIPLVPGWNQIADPFIFPVAWSQVSAADSSGPVVLEPPTGWDESLQQYSNVDVATLSPFEGCWVRNPRSGAVDLSVPPIESVAAPTARVEARVATTAAAGIDADWELRVEVSCDGHADTRNVLGADARAAEGRDALDRTEPPTPPGPAVSLRFLDPAGLEAPRTVDMRPPIPRDVDPEDQGLRFLLGVVRTGDEAAARDARLRFVGLDRLPAALAVVLVDHELDRVIDLKRTDEVAFVSTQRTGATGARTARFEVLAGSAAWVAAGGVVALPRVTRLLPIFPNPMSATATIRFELAAPGPARLEIFDAAGRRVRGLVGVSLPAGRHERAWAGEDDGGRVLAPGVYVLRFTAGGGVQQRRVVRIR
jgi:hypothetical protein